MRHWGFQGEDDGARRGPKDVLKEDMRVHENAKTDMEMGDLLLLNIKKPKKILMAQLNLQEMSKLQMLH